MAAERKTDAAKDQDKHGEYKIDHPIAITFHPFNFFYYHDIFHHVKKAASRDRAVQIAVLGCLHAQSRVFFRTVCALFLASQKR